MTMNGMRHRKPPMTRREWFELGIAAIFAMSAVPLLVGGILWAIGETIEHFTP